MPNNPAGAPSGPSSRSAQGPQYLRWRRRFAHLARWLHTYLSMLSFVLLLFFAVTGFTLNHAEWFDSQQRPAVYRGTVSKSWVNAGDPNSVAKNELVNFFRHTYHTKGALSDFHVDGDQCEVLFKGPGYEADATIDRGTGSYELTVSPFSLVALLNDLHKGRNTSQTWSGVIDFSAVFMTLVALTGLTLIFFIHKRRFSGLLLLVLGALASYLIYILWAA